MILIVLGVGLGYLARVLLGPPEEPGIDNRFLTPSPVIDTLDSNNFDSYDGSEIPFDRRDSNNENANHTSCPNEAELNAGGLVPPIQLFDAKGFRDTSSGGREFEHDSTALFEPHGKKICASGCAASRHPTAELKTGYFRKLMQTYVAGQSGESEALEELLYYGPQTVRLIRESGFCGLDSERRNFLWNELQTTHATISIRVVDESGMVRTRAESTRVPLDRRHVFEMETNNLQPLVTSGTVKRVGLDHIWVRL